MKRYSLPFDDVGRDGILSAEEVFSLDALKKAEARLRAAAPFPIATPVFKGVPVVVCDYLVKTIPGPSGRWSRFRRRLEDRFDRVGLPYVWPRVQRDRFEPQAIMMGGSLYAHPALIDQLRRSVR